MRTAKRLIGHYICYYAAVGVYLPFLPLFLAGTGLDSVRTGFLLALGPLTSMLAQVLWGNFADRHNRRKEYLVVAVAGTALVCIFLGLGRGIVGLAVVLFFYALFYSAIAPLTDSLALTILRDTRDFGSFRRWGSLGFGVMAAAGGLLFSYLPLKYFGFVAGSLYGLALLWTLSLPNPRGLKQAPAAGFPLRSVLSTPEVPALLAIVVLVMIPYNAYTSFLGWHLQTLGASRAWVGLAWTIAALSEVPVFGWGKSWLKRVPARKLITVGAGVYALRWLAYAFIPSYPVIVAAQITQSVSFALFYLAVVEYLASLVPPQLQSSAQGLLQAVTFGLSAIIGAAGGGWLLKAANWQALYLSMAALTGAAALGVRYLKKTGGGSPCHDLQER